MSLEKYRSELDGIDSKMLELFQERMKVEVTLNYSV